MCVCVCVYVLGDIRNCEWPIKARGLGHLGTGVTGIYEWPNDARKEAQLF